MCNVSLSSINVQRDFSLKLLIAENNTSIHTEEKKNDVLMRKEVSYRCLCREHPSPVGSEGEGASDMEYLARREASRDWGHARLTLRRMVRKD